MKRLLLGLLIASPICAMDYEPSTAMRGSAQVQAAKEKQAIQASLATYKQENERRADKQRRQTEEADMNRAIADSLKVNPKKSRKWLKWVTLAGISAVGVAVSWYFKDTISSQIRSLVRK